MDDRRRKGRPPTATTVASARIQLRVTPAQRLELRRVAVANGLGMSAVIREAVNTFVADYDDGAPPFPGRRSILSVQK